MKMNEIPTWAWITITIALTILLAIPLIPHKKKEKQKESTYINRRMKKQKKTQQTWSIKKRSMLPKGNSANTSKITYCIICMNTKICVCFRV